MKLNKLGLFLVFILVQQHAWAQQQTGAIRSRDGFFSNTLPANDDGSTGLVPIGFTVDFFGINYTDVFANNNGNITFDAPLGTFTPFDLTSTGQVIIAPFFADVDTREGNVVTFGQDTVDGRPAFGVNWIQVGYFSANTDRLNSFQLILIDRSDISPGDFDIEFNYDQIQWETGDASGGDGGLGGNSARAGFSNGTGDPGTFFELQGSAVNGAFLDSNLQTGLIRNSFGSEVPGRYIFQVRGGTVVPPELTLGDGNGDGIVDGADLVALVLEIFDGDGNLVENVAAGSFPGRTTMDVNQDGIISQVDVDELSDLLFEQQETAE